MPYSKTIVVDSQLAKMLGVGVQCDAKRPLVAEETGYGSTSCVSKAKSPYWVNEFVVGFAIPIR